MVAVGCNKWHMKAILRPLRDAGTTDYIGRIIFVTKKIRLGRTYRWLVAALLATVAVIPCVSDASCPGLDPFLPGYDPDYYSVSKELARSRCVVVGRVVSETWLGEGGKPKTLHPPFQGGRPRPWGFDPYIGAVYDVKVLRVIKGKPGPQLSLFSENSTARFWLTVGNEYLFFVSEETFDEPVGRRLTIDPCGNSTCAGKATEVLKQITQSKQPK